MQSKDNPTPGSPEAVARGCTCPVIDNHHGRGVKPGVFWINKDCPLHVPELIAGEDLEGGRARH